MEDGEISLDLDPTSSTIWSTLPSQLVLKTGIGEKHLTQYLTPDPRIRDRMSS